MKIFEFLSMKYLGLLLLLFAMVCGIATFVEHYFSTPVAQTAIYHTLWFESLLATASLSLLYNIYVFKLYKKSKLGIGLFHFALVLMIVGAGITRHFGEDGQLHLRKGQEVNYFFTKHKDHTKKIKIPFSIRLKSFDIEYYPGSETPSEYRSNVYVLENDRIVRHEDIYMNHILKHKGYRFFQSSYDNDLNGSILSVNHDPIGSAVTYTGYFLLFLGMMIALFAKGSRFQKLNRSLNGKNLILIILFGLISSLNIKAEVLNDKTYSAFSQLMMSNGKGRLHPMNTINLQLTKKLTHERSYDGLNADQLIINMLIFPEKWKNESFIYIDNEAIAKQLKAKKSYLRYNDFFNSKGQYKLFKELEIAHKKALEDQTKYDKKVIAITEKVSIFKMIVEGTFLTIYPPEDLSKRVWLTPQDISNKDKDIWLINEQLKQAILSQKNKEMQAVFSSIKEYQIATIGHQLPSRNKIKSEQIYNKLNVFTRLAPTYATLAIILLIVSIIRLINPTRLRRVEKTCHYIVGAVFIMHTFALGIRWFISGHAPMSNGYESMIVVAWAAVLGGLFFTKKSPITLAISTILSAATLMVAYINSMNPEITALVPVLNSNWLSVHVATITASYGLLSVCALLGLFNICLIAFAPTNMHKTIKELTTVSQLLMILGIYLLTIGCFIGAIWANESWGRYWSWDPKETWCLITIVVYAFIIHMHHVPSLSDSFAYNTASLWGLSSILMTYFGVNYFLGGMHSYGKGESEGISIVYYLLIITLLIVNAKAFKSKKTSKKTAS